MRTIAFLTAAMAVSGASAEEPMSDVLPLTPHMEVSVPCLQEKLPLFVGGQLTDDRLGFIAAAQDERSASVILQGERAESDIGYITQIETQLNSAGPFDLEGLTQTFTSTAEAEIALKEVFGDYNSESLRQYLEAECSARVLAPAV
ncbi:MAG: hypothetical protein AAF244_01250 [Pseudomonadota bacterium]